MQAAVTVKAKARGSQELVLHLLLKREDSYGLINLQASINLSSKSFHGAGDMPGHLTVYPFEDLRRD